MTSAEFSVKERAVMFALLGEARRLSNPELEERVGFRLDGKERRKLNDLKLVESEKLGRAFAHELSDAGWRWCADQLSAGPGERATSMERALYAIFAGLERYLSDTGQILADVFRQREAGQSRTGGSPVVKPEAGQSRDDGDIESLIEAAYRALTPVRGEFVKLRELRGRLAGASELDVDSALEKMYAQQRINLIPQSNQQALSEADRESALRVGGEYKHLISIE
jgi:hypothetical protein